MGRSRGGLTTKINAVVDARGRPIRFALTPGQVHDSQAASELLEPLPGGCVVLGDKAYDSDDIREQIEEAGAIANIPPKANRRAPPPFDAKLYKQRNLIERFSNKIKHFRRIADATKSAPPTFSPLSSARQSEFGCVLMSPWPS